LRFAATIFVGSGKDTLMLGEQKYLVTVVRDMSVSVGKTGALGDNDELPKTAAD
jgi:hypothetical protein